MSLQSYLKYGFFTVLMVIHKDGRPDHIHCVTTQKLVSFWPEGWTWTHKKFFWPFEDTFFGNHYFSLGLFGPIAAKPNPRGFQFNFCQNRTIFTFKMRYYGALYSKRLWSYDYFKIFGLKIGKNENMQKLPIFFTKIHLQWHHRY